MVAHVFRRFVDGQSLALHFIRQLSMALDEIVPRAFGVDAVQSLLASIVRNEEVEISVDETEERPATLTGDGEGEAVSVEAPIEKRPAQGRVHTTDPSQLCQGGQDIQRASHTVHHLSFHKTRCVENERGVIAGQSKLIFSRWAMLSRRRRAVVPIKGENTIFAS